MGTDDLHPHRRLVHGAHDLGWFAAALLLSFAVLMLAASAAIAPGH